MGQTQGEQTTFEDLDSHLALLMPRSFQEALTVAGGAGRVQVEGKGNTFLKITWRQI